MRIGVIGTGYVGLVSGTCFAEFGIEVVCMDLDAAKIERLKKGEVPIYEPGLEDLLARQIKAGRIRFTTDLKDAVAESDAVFIAVGTPTRQTDGHADLTYVYQAAKDIAQHLNGYTVIVTKSTVPVGTAIEVEDIIRKAAPSADFDVASNPEFLREGAAINDFMRPDRVVIGVTSERARKVMRELYRPLYLNETPIVFTQRQTAEIIKYAANAFLATKITFINEIANLCEAAGADVQDVSKAIGLDKRIGAKFLHAGPGYGGSCFPKDTLALVQTGQKMKAPQTIVEAVVAANDERRRDMARRIIEACGGSVKGKRIGILGVAFKPETDDIRDSATLEIIPLLQEAGASVAAYDPAAMDHAKKILKNVDWKTNPYDVADKADALAIVTEWNEFRAMDLERIADSMNDKLLLDFRNIYKRLEMNEAGFRYLSIGRPDIAPDNAPQQLKAVGAKVLIVPGLIIFDCDGTLVDSEYLHNKAVSDVLVSIGLTQYDVEYCLTHFTGKSLPTVTAMIEADNKIRLPGDFIVRYIGLVTERMPAELHSIEGVEDTLMVLMGRIPLCVASNGERGNVMNALRIATLDRFFPAEHVFTKDMVRNPKPAPDLFLHAAARMGVAPKATIVLEDSVTGAKAGVAAGMTVIGFTGTYHDAPRQAENLWQAEATFCISRFADLLDILEQKPCGLSTGTNG